MGRSVNQPMNVVPLNEASDRKKRRSGRPANPEMPPLPQEILDGMSEIEKEHFGYFRQAYEQAYSIPFADQPGISF